MSDDISSKLQQLKDMLSDDQTREKLMSVMNILPNGQSKNEDSEAQQSNQQSINSFLNSDTEMMINKMRKFMDQRNHVNDPRAILLNALKPYLGQKRQGRIDSYNKMLNFIQLSSLLNDDDI